MARRYLGFRRSLPARVAAPAVGVLEIHRDGIVARAVPLPPG
jgi:hypothetical protein